MSEGNGATGAVRVSVALVITAVWAVTVIASLLSDRYTVLEIVTPVMLLPAGYLFGVKIVRPGRE